MQISEKQLTLVNDRLQAILKSDNYFAKMYREMGITEIRTPQDFKKLPFIDKAELRNAYPLGVPDSEIVRIHSSSGTTGKPVIIPYTAKDVDDWAIMFARCYETAGITKEDRIQITPGYGLWTAGIGFQAGCEKLGAMAIPMGPGNTEKQLQMMQDLKSTVICATSSYALLLAEEINKRGLKDNIRLKKGVIGSERWSEKKREYIANELGIELYDIYGLTEIYGPGIGVNCSLQTGMHIWDDYLYTEIIDPVTGENVEDGEEGEIVITPSSRKARRCLDSARMICRGSSPENAPAAVIIPDWTSSEEDPTICSRCTASICSPARSKSCSAPSTAYRANTRSTSRTTTRKTAISSC